MAVLGQDGGLDFSSLNRAANRVAHELRDALGTAPGFVGICLPRSVQRLVVALGVMKAGHGYVAIDPQWHPAGRTYIAAHAGVLGVVTDSGMMDEFAADCRVVVADALGTRGLEADPSVYPAPEAHAYLRYTSGSTGDPKGVLHNHRAALGQSLCYGCGNRAAGGGSALLYVLLPAPDHLRHVAVAWGLRCRRSGEGRPSRHRGAAARGWH